MGKTYVVSDIHGRFDLLELALAELSRQEVGRVIFTGDYIDRGRDSEKVVSRLIAGPSGGWKWSFIRGNHEDMALHCADGTDLSWWIGNGGAATLASYGEEVSGDHLDWFDSLDRLIWDRHRVYTHAGVGEQFELTEQPETITQWFRYPHGANVGYRGKHVVHGHTPKRDGPELLQNRTNLDVGAFFTGRLVVGVFDDDKAGGPVEILEFTEATQ